MVSVICWAANMPATRFIMQFYGFGSLALFRFAVAAMLLCAIAAVRRTKLPKIKDIPKFAVAGLFGIFLFTTFVNIGATFVYAGIASFIVNSSPVFTLIMAWVILKEKVKPACWIGILISFCGLIGVMLAQAAEFSFNIGLLLLLIPSISNGVYTVVQRKLYKSYSFFEATTFSLIAGTVFFLFFIPDLARDLTSEAIPWQMHIFAFILGVFPAAVAFLTWGYALAKVEKTAHITAFMYLIPFIATLIGFLWMGETLSFWTFLGGAVIIGGMILTNTLGKSK